MLKGMESLHQAITNLLRNGVPKINLELKQKDVECKKLGKELRRKEKALAETAALLALRKNAYAI